MTAVEVTDPLPQGTVTFLFTDIEGSTLLVQELGSGWIQVLEAQRRIMRRAIAAHGGREMGTEGDSFFVVFPSAVAAVDAVVEAQHSLRAEPWPAGFPVRVRMGLHTGEAAVVDGGYVGLEVHRAARIAASGHGGQILISKATAEVIGRGLRPDAKLRELGEYRLKDLPRPESILQLDVEGLETDFPKLKSLDIRKNNLPLQLTSFLGREAELIELRELLSHERLVTLLGPGGMGKTRLAIELASDLMEDYEHGVWLVELAPITEAALVVPTVLNIFGLREQPGRPPLETLVDYLEPRQVLLVLDNCEHLIHAAADLTASLLKACPRLRIVATSREYLRLSGEAAIRIPPLTVPAADELPFAALAESTAVALFVARAQSAKPTFELTTANAPAVLHVCRSLDGIPLGIELAAARLPLLSIDQLAGRLDDRFKLLTGGSRTALPRQQTLRATIDWSFDLLAEPERVLMRRLAVFGDGFSLEATEAVCAGDPVDPIDVLDLLGELVGKSLVVPVERADEPRFRLLETIKQYAAERLRGAGEADGLALRHRDWFAAAAERAENQLHGSEQHVWFGRLERDLQNLRGALDTALATDPSLALRFAAELGLFWRVTGRFHEGREWLRRALAGSSEETASRAKALAWLGLLTSYQGGYAEAAPLQEESFVIYEDLNDTWGMAFATQNLAAALHAQDDYETAADLHRRSLALFRETGDKPSIGLALTHLGFGALYAGDYAAASQNLEDALAVFREVDDRRQIGIALELMGEVELAQGHYTPAASLLGESLGIVRSAGDKVDVAYTLRLLGTVARCQGDYDHSQELHEESLQLARDFNVSEYAGESLTELGLLWQLRGDLDRADACLKEALLLFHPRERFGISRCLEAFAVLRCCRGRNLAAATLFGAAEAMRAEIGSSLRPYEAAEHERHIAAVKSQLAPTEFDAAWRSGAAMNGDEAIAYATHDVAETWPMTAPASRPAELRRPAGV